MGFSFKNHGVQKLREVLKKLLGVLLWWGIGGGMEIVMDFFRCDLLEGTVEFVLRSSKASFSVNYQLQMYKF